MLYPHLITHIRKHVPLSEEEAEQLSQALRAVVVRKKELLLEEGQICRSLYFVEEGCARMYYINGKGSEQTIQFAIEKWWISDYTSFNGQCASGFYIQALEPSTLLALDHSRQDQLFRELPQLNDYFRMILQRAYAASQQRIKYMFDLSREEMFRHFNASHPEFVQRVPQYMLASYLGLSPEYLSEIRRKKS